MNELCRRIVLWADTGAAAVDWAERHAAARTLPLHLVHFPAPPTPAGLAHARQNDGPRLTAKDPDAVNAVRLVRTANAIHARHGALQVTFHIVQDGYVRPWPGLTRPGDVLVTGLSGYRSLLMGDESQRDANHAASAVCVASPTIVVPDDAMGEDTGHAGVLLVTGQRPSPATIEFAFEAAEDLDTGLTVVQMGRLSAAYGDDYWVDGDRTAQDADARLRADLVAALDQHKAVHLSLCTLRAQPWVTLRVMAAAASLAVVDDVPEERKSLQSLLDLGACPVAVVPQ